MAYNYEASYIDAQMARLRERQTLAVLGMYKALDYVKFKEKNQDRAKRAVQTIMHKMTSSPEYNDKIKKKNLLAKKLKDEESVKFLSSYDILDDIVTAAKSRFIIDWVEKDRTESYSYGPKHDILYAIADKIASDPKQAVLYYASEYTNAVYSMEQAKAEKQAALKAAEQAKAEAARKRAEEEARRRQREQEYSTPVGYGYDSTPTPGPSRPSYVDRTQYPREPYVSQTYSTDRRNRDAIVSEEYIQAEIDKKIANGDAYLDYDLRRQIEKKYKQLDNMEYYGEFYGPNNIEAIYRYHVLCETDNKTYSETMRYGKIVEMGTLAVDILFKDLKNGRFAETTNMARFMNQFQPHKALERYEQARENYMKFYNRLNEKDKNRIDTYAAKFDSYRDMFHLYGKTGKDIATVSDIKRVVNMRIKDYYIDENVVQHNYRRDEGFSFQFAESLRYSLQYMSSEEIASLYIAIRSKNTYNNYSFYTEEERKQAYEYNQKENAAIQELFAEAIRYRLVNIERPKDWNNDQEKEAYLRKREIDLTGICQDYFHEQPQFTLYHTADTKVEEGYGKARVESSEAITEAQRRYYGLGKLQQVLGTMNFSRLRELGKKDTLSPDEMSMVKSMF